VQLHDPIARSPAHHTTPWIAGIAAIFHNPGEKGSVRLVGAWPARLVMER
jgi:hypothetical protein